MTRSETAAVPNVSDVPLSCARRRASTFLTRTALISPDPDLDLHPRPSVADCFCVLLKQANYWRDDADTAAATAPNLNVCVRDSGHDAPEARRAQSKDEAPVGEFASRVQSVADAHWRRRPLPLAAPDQRVIGDVCWQEAIKST